MSRIQFIFSFSCLLFFVSFFNLPNFQRNEKATEDTVIYLPLIFKDFGIPPTQTPTASPTATKTNKPKTSTPTRTQTKTSTPFRTFTPIPTSTITPTATLTPTSTFTPTLTPTTTYLPLPEITLIYPTLTPSSTATRTATLESTATPTLEPLFGSHNNQARLGLLALVGLVWGLLAAWLVILIRRNRADQEEAE